MSFPVQITFRNLEATETIEGWIRAQAAKLDTFYRRIVCCRVVVEVPHEHHRRGNLYNVRIIRDRRRRPLQRWLTPARSEEVGT
jgi:ribosome-associated translation inhibitor RaiA